MPAVCRRAINAAPETEKKMPELFLKQSLYCVIKILEKFKNILNCKIKDTAANTEKRVCLLRQKGAIIKFPSAKYCRVQKYIKSKT